MWETAGWSLDFTALPQKRQGLLIHPLNLNCPCDLLLSTERGRRKTGQVPVLAFNRSDSFSACCDGNSAVALETSQFWRCCYHIGKPQSKVSHGHYAIAHKCLSKVNWARWAQLKRPADSGAKWVTVVVSHQVFESCTRQEESQRWSGQSREWFPSLEHFAWGQMLGNRPVSYTHKHPRGVCVCERLMYKWPLWIPSTVNSHTGASTQIWNSKISHPS